MRKPSPETLAILVAFLWGWSEATWFFVIPDVFLTFTALLGWRTVILATSAAVFGSVCGAMTLYALPTGALHLLVDGWKALPVVREAMFPVAATHLQTGLWGIAEGPVAGIPFRVYVWLCIQKHVPLSSVLWITPWVRLERMIWPPLIALGVLTGMRKLSGDGVGIERSCVLTWSLIWVAIYGYYWLVFLPRHFG